MQVTDIFYPSDSDADELAYALEDGLAALRMRMRTTLYILAGLSAALFSLGLLFYFQYHVIREHPSLIGALLVALILFTYGFVAALRYRSLLASAEDQAAAALSRLAHFFYMPTDYGSNY